VRTATALVTRDLLRVLWRARTVALVLFLAAGAWAAVSPPDVSDGRSLRSLGTAVTDAIPTAFGSDWTTVATQALPLALLAAALVVEEREDGGTWMTAHRAGGLLRWWSAKALSAVTLCAVVVLAGAALTAIAALLRGWDLSLGPSEYARAGSELGYVRIDGTSPLAQSLLVVALRIAALAPVALLAIAAGALVRRPGVAYGVVVVGLLAYWRLAAGAMPERLAQRADLLTQAFWKQHGAGFDASWWWTPVVIAAWTVAALALGRLVARHTEVTRA
jgi:hypothetical protein